MENPGVPQEVSPRRGPALPRMSRRARKQQTSQSRKENVNFLSKAARGRQNGESKGPTGRKSQGMASTPQKPDCTTFVRVLPQRLIAEHPRLRTRFKGPLGPGIPTTKKIKITKKHEKWNRAKTIVFLGRNTHGLSRRLSGSDTTCTNHRACAQKLWAQRARPRAIQRDFDRFS